MAKAKTRELTTDEKKALAHVAHHYGVRWRVTLKKAWENGTVRRIAWDDEQASVLQRMRNDPTLDIDRVVLPLAQVAR